MKTNGKMEQSMECATTFQDLRHAFLELKFVLFINSYRWLFLCMAGSRTSIVVKEGLSGVNALTAEMVEAGAGTIDHPKIRPSNSK